MLFVILCFYEFPLPCHGRYEFARYYPSTRYELHRVSFLASREIQEIVWRRLVENGVRILGRNLKADAVFSPAFPLQIHQEPLATYFLLLYKIAQDVE